MRNGMPESDTVDLLSAQAIDGDAEVDNHPARCVEGSRVGHLHQPVGERTFGRYHARNLLRRIVRILESFLNLDHDLRKGRQIHASGRQRVRQAAQEFEGWKVSSSHTSSPATGDEFHLWRSV